MKYLIEWAFDQEKIDETIKLNMDYMKEEEKYPGKYYKYVFPPHYIGNGKGISVVEISDPQQLINAQVILERCFKMTFIPITDIGEQITTYMTIKQ